MVTAQQLLDLFAGPDYRPMTYQEIERYFEIDNADDFKALLKLLNDMEENASIYRTRSGRYSLPDRLNLIRGRLQAHAKGFGFLLPEDKELPDVYINANDMNGAMNGDTVLVRITVRGPAGGKLEGEVAKIVERGTSQVVGYFQDNGSYAFIIPDDKRLARDIFVPKESFHGAVDGQKVVAKIVSYPEGRSAAEGEIIEILGHKNDPGVDILSIIRKFQLPEQFSEEVMAEAEKVPDEIHPDELKGRRDLRGKRIVTIDGEDAKDLDDAVQVERLENGNYLLGVHIADVSYYVRENSALDREAYNRGCSVYLVDRVIPMLPHRLSNGICSLNPQVDRLTMSCEMEIDPKGHVVRHDVFTSVIKTAERMTYSNVRKILQEPDEHPDLLERYAPLVDDFRLMEELAMILRRRRMERGAIDFDFQESKILVDENGKPTDIVKRERSIAEMIIEEFMLKANETVAEHFYFLKIPFLYRIHEDPDAEKLLNFVGFVANFGYTVRGKGNRVHPKALQSLLEEIKGAKEETVISTVLLRSMKQARYDAESTGHFGLAAEYYSHFTSPIRRYPDLIIHRMIREVLEKGTLSEQRIEHLKERMQDIARQSSERERVAVDAERETDALKKAEFMLDKVGEEFEGIISSVTSFGMFIELPNTVEGLIRLSDLTDDYYHYNDQQHLLLGERTSKIYRIGDEVKVRVTRVNLDEHTIDFELVDMKPRRAGEGGFGRGRNGGRGGDRREAAGGRGRKGAAAAEGGGRGKGRSAGAKRGRGAAAGAGGAQPAEGAAAAAAQPAVGAGGGKRRSGRKGAGAPEGAAQAAPAAGERGADAAGAGAAGGGAKRGKRGRGGASVDAGRGPVGSADEAPAVIWPDRPGTSRRRPGGGEGVEVGDFTVRPAGKPRGKRPFYAGAPKGGKRKK
ncbi:ribonuclease R [Paenibacillus sp. J31TS4]|uniref:ribonuclease R n=1 Tax=Paenibacillus sp. J31TS4 TaxID=2807195 RepID=UPI001B258459|nr:ribonuclease R [Paenibacillus sp. J31TS4]GIP40253.1 ribonuclease R [Paenibacillus sp. J31TS4]